MKVLLVNGSPHQFGCTNRALEEVKNSLDKEGIDAEIYWIGNNVLGCRACGSCHKTGKCVINDGLNEFAAKATEADGLVFGTPVYYSGPSGMMVSFMNRLFYSHGRSFARKPVASVVSCRRGGASETFAVMNQHYLMSNMIVVGSQYWNQVHGFTPSDVEKDLEGLQTMRTLGLNMAWIIKSINKAKEEGVEEPAYEPFTPTHFIR